VLTPPGSGNANSDTVYPPGSISLLHGISPIGDKFHSAASYGPSAQLNVAAGFTLVKPAFLWPIVTHSRGPGRIDGNRRSVSSELELEQALPGQRATT